MVKPSKTHPIGNITQRLIDRHYKVISRQLRMAGALEPRALIARRNDTFAPINEDERTRRRTRLEINQRRREFLNAQHAFTLFIRQPRKLPGTEANKKRKEKENENEAKKKKENTRNLRTRYMYTVTVHKSRNICWF